jgi:hypothetical protein
MRYLASLVLFFGSLAQLSKPVYASELAQCAPDFTSCVIPKNVMLQLRFSAISGNAIVREPHSTIVSDVFRIFHDLIDTGGGTGLRNMAFRYSSDDSTPLPDLSTYSVNAVFLTEGSSGITHYLGNGTDYILNDPEPSTFALLGLGLVAIAGFTRRRPQPWLLTGNLG